MPRALGRLPRSVHEELRFLLLLLLLLYEIIIFRFFFHSFFFVVFLLRFLSLSFLFFDEDDLLAM